MFTKKSMMFFLFVFPITFIIGMMISLAFSFQFHDEVHLNWLLAVAIALCLDLFIVWRNKRDSSRSNGAQQ